MPGSDAAVGAQNVHHELAGAFTGEVSAPMLAGLGSWVIVGHSERRRDAGETDDLIGRKVAAALDAGLRPILCVGESGYRVRRLTWSGARSSSKPQSKLIAISMLLQMTASSRLRGRSVRSTAGQRALGSP